MPKVKLIDHTPDPEKVVVLAARQTRSEGLVDEGELTEELIDKVMRTLIFRKHLSPLEHAYFTFLVWDISRICSHQLVRHRMASYSQQSQRVVKLTRASFITPPSILEKEEALRIYNESLNFAVNAYNELVSMGIPKEDARFVLPQAIETKLVVTMNARELLHFFGLRLCKKAQWEIRELALKMLEEVKKVAPVMFKYAGPRCWDYHYCPEGDSKCFLATIKEKPR